MTPARKLIVQYTTGILVGTSITFVLFNLGAPDETPLLGKAFGALLCVIAAFWHFMSHRTKDKSALDLRKF